MRFDICCKTERYLAPMSDSSISNLYAREPLYEFVYWLIKHEIDSSIQKRNLVNIRSTYR